MLKHVGRLQVESEVGEGTVFEVWLPISAPKAERESSPGEA